MRIWYTAYEVQVLPDEALGALEVLITGPSPSLFREDTYISPLETPEGNLYRIDAAAMGVDSLPTSGDCLGLIRRFRASILPVGALGLRTIQVNVVYYTDEAPHWVAKLRRESEGVFFTVPLLDYDPFRVEVSDEVRRPRFEREDVL